MQTGLLTHDVFAPNGPDKRTIYTGFIMPVIAGFDMYSERADLKVFT